MRRFRVGVSGIAVSVLSIRLERQRICICMLHAACRLSLRALLERRGAGTNVLGLWSKSHEAIGYRNVQFKRVVQVPPLCIRSNHARFYEIRGKGTVHVKTLAIKLRRWSHSTHVCVSKENTRPPACL